MAVEGLIHAGATENALLAKTAEKTAETKAANAIGEGFFNAPRMNQVPRGFNMMDQAGTHEGRLKIEKSLRMNQGI